jgi:hypothetical protein
MFRTTTTMTGVQTAEATTVIEPRKLTKEKE